MKLIINLSDSQDAMHFDRNIPDGVSISHPPVMIRKDFGFKEALELIVSFSTDIEKSLLATWLVNTFVKCKRNRSSGDITINRREFHFKDGEIEKIIEETINSSHN